jgi:hypothetical protein
MTIEQALKARGLLNELGEVQTMLKEINRNDSASEIAVRNRSGNDPSKAFDIAIYDERFVHSILWMARAHLEQMERKLTKEIELL